VDLPVGERMFTRFDTIHERDRQTDGRTPHDGIDRGMQCRETEIRPILPILG